MSCISQGFKCLDICRSIAESATFALKIENVGITGFDDL